MSKRGIVVAPDIFETERGLKTKDVPISQPLLYQYLVYWDQVVMVSARGTPFNFGERDLLNREDLEPAFEEGDLAVREVTFSDTEWGISEVAVAYAKAQQRTFRRLSREEEEGYWTVGQSADRLVLPEDEAVTRDTVTSRLVNALPVPGGEVDAEEILNFRRDRRPELLAFRSAYEGFYRDVLESEEKELALQQAVEELERALDDLHRAMDEGDLNPTRLSMEALWKVPVEIGSAANIAEGLLDAPLLFTVFVGTVQAAVSMNSREAQRPEDIPDEVEAYAYLKGVEEEL